MNIVRKSLAIVVAIGCCFTMVGCDLDTVPQALYIMGSVQPDDSCKVKSQGGSQQELMGSGTLDLSVGSRYQAWLMTANQFPASETLTGFQPPDARLDSSTVTIDGAILTYRVDPTLLAQEAVINTLAEMGIPPTTSISVTVPAASTIATNSSMPVVVNLIPDNMGNVFRGFTELADREKIEVVVEVILTGYRSDDKVVKSRPWEFSITLCNNCMVDHLFSEAIAKQPFTWPGLESPLDPTKDFGPFCIPGQDRRITNAWCGGQYGPDSAVTDLCKLDRCLGKQADSLQCDTDAKIFGAPPKAEE
jgi:hypothetical protein